MVLSRPVFPATSPAGISAYPLCGAVFLDDEEGMPDEVLIHVKFVHCVVSVHKICLRAGDNHLFRV